MARSERQFLVVMRGAMSVAGVVVMGIFAVAFAYCVWTLSRAAVREEFRNEKHMA